MKTNNGIAREQALTMREIACLQALTEGLSSKDIASQLSISLPTVAMHLTNARRKLHASTREQAIAIALRSGFLK